MDFDTQANGMIILHRFNLFKRLESSVYSFEETLRRLLERIERTERLLLKGSGKVEEEDSGFDDSDSDDVYIEGKYEIDVKHLRVHDYLDDLEKVAAVLSDAHILVTGLSVSGDTLEDYFLSKIGGSENVKSPKY